MQQEFKQMRASIDRSWGNSYGEQEGASVTAVKVWQTHKSLLALLTIYLLFSAVYSLVTPLFEAPDEMDHFRYINWLATGKGLPHLAADLAAAGHEIGQPPLYYALLALPVSFINTDDLEEVAPMNPYWREGAGLNVHYHTEREQFPYHQTTLAVHVARFGSILMGMITIMCTYALARYIIPAQAALAAALVAFNPQFVFISAVINNDNLITAVSALVLLLLVRNLVATRPLLGLYVLVGLFWGLAILSKVSGVALFGVILFALLVTAWRHHSYRLLLMGLGLVTIPAALTAGWWFGRNAWIYGDPLAWDLFLNANQGVMRALLLSWTEAGQWAYQLVPSSFWAAFGYGLPAPASFYLFVKMIMLLALVGLVKWGVNSGQKNLKSPQTLAVLLLLVWCIIVGVMLVQWIRQVVQAEQGRLYFPAISSLAVLMALGLTTLLQSRPWVLRGIMVVLAVWTAVMPLLIIQPAYAQPQTLPTSVTIPNPQQVQFGDHIHLLGYQLRQSSLQTGEQLVVDLYWEAGQPITDSYAVSLTVTDAAGQVVSSLDTIPYQGRYATAVWRPAQPFKDTYTLPPIISQPVPGQGHIYLTLYPWRQTEKVLPVTVHTTDVGSSFTLSTIKIAPSEAVRRQPDVEMVTDFGRVARLMGYDMADTAVAGQPLPITLYWDAMEPDGQEYTVFVHMLNESGQLIAQADAPPQANTYPTSIWASGEQIRDQHILLLPANLPDGVYHVLVGLYHTQTGERLPATLPGGERWLHDAVELVTIHLGK